jgi:hypothetical protein
MPEQIKTLLRKAGFKKKALTNKLTAVTIFKNLMMNMDFSSVEQEEQITTADAKPFETNDGRPRGNSSSSFMISKMESGLAAKFKSTLGNGSV